MTKQKINLSKLPKQIINRSNLNPEGFEVYLYDNMWLSKIDIELIELDKQKNENKE